MQILICMKKATNAWLFFTGVKDLNPSNDFLLRNGTTLDSESLMFKKIFNPQTLSERRWNKYLPDGWILGDRIRPFAESCKNSYHVLNI